MIYTAPWKNRRGGETDGKEVHPEVAFLGLSTLLTALKDLTLASERQHSTGSCCVLDVLRHAGT